MLVHGGNLALEGGPEKARSKQFFFAKKNQKTFANLALRYPTARAK
jgi:hypothetical protein